MATAGELVNHSHRVTVEGPREGSRLPTFYRVYPPLRGAAALQERVMTGFIDLAAKAGVGVRELPYYLQPGNLGHLAVNSAMGATRYAVNWLRDRVMRSDSTGRLEAVLAGAETPQPYKQS